MHSPRWTGRKETGVGAWGAGSFENDDAMDWVIDLEESDDEYLWASERSKTVAAAEVVAALAGRPGPGSPERVESWVRGRDGVERETVALATRAVERVRNGPRSELLELREEAGQPEEWYEGVEDLLGRLGR